MVVFCVVQYSILAVCLHFGVTYCFHLQGCVFFSPEDDAACSSAGMLAKYYTVQQHRRPAFKYDLLRYIFVLIAIIQM
jgi:hypothetical protein